jgi:hypothetical protein
MASSILLQRTVNFGQQCLRNAPLVGIGGFANEPAFSIADWVRQFILGPPFSWRWNRVVTTFSTVQGTQSYTQALPSFGWIEKATVSDGTTTKELQVALNLASDSVQNRPISISPVLDDDSGNITFYLLPVPDKAYTVSVTYQKAAPVFANLTDTWAPIPDYYYYLIETGFLAKSYEYNNDERFAPTMQMFVRQVLAANAGLADTQKNLYMEEFINSAREQQAELGNSQAGRAGRGLFQ